MTAQDWSDHHSWLVASDTMRAAHLALGDGDYAALFYASVHWGADYLAPREAIENAALAMPPAMAIQFLGAVYQLDHPTAEKVLGAIRTVRKI